MARSHRKDDNSLCNKVIVKLFHRQGKSLTVIADDPNFQPSLNYIAVHIIVIN